MIASTDIDDIVNQYPGRIGLFVEYLETREVYENNSRGLFPTASVCKIPVMVELFRQVTSGQISLNDRYHIDDSISTHGTGILKLMNEPVEMTAMDYCRLMITVSDNMATDVLINVLGLESINSTMGIMGLPNTRVNMTMGRWHYAMAGLQNKPITPENDARLLEASGSRSLDYDAISFKDSLANNVTTPREIATLLKRMFNQELISCKASMQMISFLMGCEDRRMLPRYVPPEISVAHKIGSSSRIKVDVGLVLDSGQTALVSAFALSDKHTTDGTETIAGLCRVALGYK